MRRLLAYRSNRRILLIATVGLACLCGAATWTALGLLHGREPAAANEPPVAQTFRLADGTEIPLEEWGETYEAWERAPTIETAKARTVLELPTGDVRYLFAIAADAPRKRIFWLIYRVGAEGCQIGVVNYDGGGRRVIVDRLTGASLLSVDSPGGKLYWTDRDASGGYTLHRANLDGSSKEAVITGLKGPKSVSIDSSEGTIYFVDEDRIMSVPIAGGREQVLTRDSEITHGSPWASAYEPVTKRLYWSTRKSISSTLASGKEFSTSDVQIVAIPRPERVLNLVADKASSRLYWADNFGVCRSQFDGARFERLTDLVGGLFCYCAVDAAAGKLFFTAKNRWRICSANLPADPKKVVKPAPPVIRAFVPEAAGATEPLTLIGEGFSGALSVACVEDATGRHVPTSFNVDSDSQLKLQTPKFSADCKRFTVIVRTSAGTTVLLPRDAQSVAKTRSLKRGEDTDGFVYVVRRGGNLEKLEQRIAYVESGGNADPDLRGAVVFLRNGAAFRSGGIQGNTVYREPFSELKYRTDMKLENTHIEVPAIRPSFVESLPAYRR